MYTKELSTCFMFSFLFMDSVLMSGAYLLSDCVSLRFDMINNSAGMYSLSISVVSPACVPVSLVAALTNAN
ncbi:hypothetical protein BgiMline_028820 [Biomphalaria glabrata]|nr:hypothetical protein BgiMline_025463 [Biomphalaria glabrata]